MDYLIPADVIAAAAEAMDAEAIRCLGRDLGTVHRDDIAAAALGAALAAGLLAVPAAHQDQWVKQVDDPKELPGLLLRMADLLDALESLPASLRRCADVARIQANASPAAPRSHRARHDVYVRLSDEVVAKTRGPWDGVNVDLDENDQVVGVEVLAALEIAVDGRRVAAAPADDAATVECVAVALWDTYTSRPAHNVDDRHAAFWRVAACAALAALREGQ